MRPQCKILKHHVHMALLRRQDFSRLRDHLSVHDHAPAIGRQHACDNVQQGGFSAAGRTQYADDLVFMDFHADSLKHFRLSKAFCQIFYF